MRTLTFPQNLTAADLKNNLHDIQDNVVAPILMRYGRHVFLKFTDGAKARAWLRTMFDRVNARQPEHGTRFTVNIGFTWGLSSESTMSTSAAGYVPDRDGDRAASPRRTAARGLSPGVSGTPGTSHLLEKPPNPPAFPRARDAAAAPNRRRHATPGLELLPYGQ